MYGLESLTEPVLFDMRKLKSGAWPSEGVEVRLNN